jgi:hypothetical protein
VRWQTVGRGEIDELIAAYRVVGGVGRSRRTATQQINQALVVQLAAQFQRYCRDLHDECAGAIVASASPQYQPLLELALTAGRKLDSQSAQPGSLGSDFGRFGFDFWIAVDRLGPQFAERRRQLAQLAVWRNAVAHQDFRRPATDPVAAGTRVDLPSVRRWRRSLEQLAGGFDRTMWVEVGRIIGAPPW